MHFMSEGSDDWCLYLGEKKGSFFIGFNILQRGWKSSSRIKSGLEYWQPAFIVGKLFTNSSKWLRLPTLYIPANIYQLWKKRNRAYREAVAADQMSEEEPV